MNIETVWPTRLRALALGCAVASIAASATAQGVVIIPRQGAPAPIARTAPLPPAQPVRTTVRIPEGTEVRIRFDEPLSSATAVTGDTFSISTDEEIVLGDGTVIPAGYRGRGEVELAQKKEMLGKAGDLSVRLDFIRIGNVRVHLRANKSAEGKSTLTSTVVLSLLLTPLFLMHHGHDIVIPQGQTPMAYVDDDSDVAFPLAAPPRGE